MKINRANEKIVRGQRGQALIISVLLISVVGAIAFAVALIGLSEYTSGKNIEHSIEAYYSAEAGIEDGLKRFKNFPSQPFEIPAGATAETTMVRQVDLDANPITVVPYNTANGEPPAMVGGAPHHYYWLKAYSKGICNPLALGATGNCLFDLSKDESVTLDLSSFTAANPQFQISVQKIGTASTGRRDAWFRWYNVNGTALSDIPAGGLLGRVSRDFYECFTGDTNPTYPSTPITQISPFPLTECRGMVIDQPNPANNFSYNNIKTHGARFLKIKAFSNETGLQPNQKVLRVFINSIGISIGGPKLYIESTGFYRGSKRKIISSFNRDTKDILDYTIYDTGDIYQYW